MPKIAWVVGDVETAKTFFLEMLGVNNFSESVTTRLQEYDGTYYGKPSNAENFVTMAYSGVVFTEIRGIPKEGEKAVEQMRGESN